MRQVFRTHTKTRFGLHDDAPNLAVSRKVIDVVAGEKALQGRENRSGRHVKPHGFFFIDINFDYRGSRTHHMADARKFRAFFELGDKVIGNGMQ